MLDRIAADVVFPRRKLVPGEQSAAHADEHFGLGDDHGTTVSATEGRRDPGVRGSLHIFTRAERSRLSEACHPAVRSRFSPPPAA